ncbi:hypothetical protein GCM10010303_39050 [Streptomyces purpurascens]|nr:hypothetical protein GCM10010303_39050 [Streptomyces purpurascens]
MGLDVGLAVAACPESGAEEPAGFVAADREASRAGHVTVAARPLTRKAPRTDSWSKSSSPSIALTVGPPPWHGALTTTRCASLISGGRS